MVTTPRITINRQANFTLGVADLFGTSAMISTSDWGEADTVIRLSSIIDVREIFKGGRIIEHAQLYFNNGGNVLDIVKLSPSDAVEASLDFNGSAGTTALSFTALHTGIYGNNINIRIRQNATNTANRDIIITDGFITETYIGLSSNANILTAINGVSEFVTIATTTGDTNLVIAGNSDLSGGSNGTPILADYTDTLSDVLFNTDFDYLLIPEETDDTFHVTISTLLSNRATTDNRFSILLAGVDRFEPINTTVERTSTNTQGRLVVCHTSYFTGTGDINDIVNWRDATFTASAYAGLLSSLSVNLSPTNKPLSIIGGKSLEDNAYNTSEREELISNGFTVVDRSFGNIYGILRGVTRIGSNTIWNYQLDSLRKVDFLASESNNSLGAFIGNPNDNITRLTIRSSMNNILTQAMRNRLVDGYEVNVNQGSTPNLVLIDVSLQLINEVDFITLNLVLQL